MSPVRLGRVARLVTTPGEDTITVSLEQIESWTGRLVGELGSRDKQAGTEFRPGDVLFGKLRPYLAKVWRADRTGVAVGDLHVYRPSSATDSDYLSYALLDRNFIDLVDSSTYGAKMPRANWDFIRQVEVEVPLPGQQRRVVDFLDRETAKVDALMEKQRTMTARLTERRSSLIEAILNDCGDRVRLVSVITVSQTGPFGTQLSADEYEDGGVPVINPTHIRRSQIEPEYGVSVSTQKAAELERHQFQENDIVLGRKGDVDKSAIIAPEQEGWICGSDAMLLRPDPARINPLYLWWFFQSRGCHAQLDLWSVGSTVSGLNQRVIRRVTLPLPALMAQVSTVQKLNAKIDSINALLKGTENFVALAQERRAALITAAVTGQLDVAMGKVA